jgi:hypothetical protein
MEWQRNVRARRRSEAARGRETPTEAHDGTQDEAEAAAGSLRQQQQQQPQAQQCSDHQSDSRIDDLVQYVQEARDASAGRVLSEDMVYCSSDNDEDDCSSDNEVQQQQQQQPLAAAAAAATAAPTAAATAAGDKP